jgi:hypothetical protein
LTITKRLTRRAATKRLARMKVKVTPTNRGLLRLPLLVSRNMLDMEAQLVGSTVHLRVEG